MGRVGGREGIRVWEVDLGSAVQEVGGVVRRRRTVVLRLGVRRGRFRIHIWGFVVSHESLLSRQ